MSNFAEFDVPETPTNQEEQTEQETKPKNANTNKTKNKTTPKRTTRFKPAILLTITGWLALILVALKTYGTFNPNLQYPLQMQLAAYTIPLMIASFVSFKLSTRIPLSKLGLFGLYLIFAIFAINKIYVLVTTGQLTWA